MNPKVEEVFKSWLKLNEDEKRDFVKELLNFNNLPEVKKKMVRNNYGL